LEIFSGQSLEAIHRNSAGIPRRINNLCDLALLMGSQQQVEVIGAELIESIWV
jgi:general secretion pathway protein A